ncbi:HesA/MoeB/ThiF family protein [Actibacterium lipolyticum]|uniref:Molybdopterin-synthase adenylyltransferase n=1 Tax=Actibacterium lipolyticum TaxID=1524263 RepID=A0A238JKP5_9RHOB|nr:molybdopterin-synthase adenylyltransferase MoeB [Actibacterium lipolyticum]SMX31248.1 putative adenylyltransferase/sulfurtransferase MoeZ [Actibacterium lipolyticum]
MGLVFAMAAVLWGIGHVMKTPIKARILMIALLYVAVLIVQVVFPDGHALRQATGGSKEAWFGLGAVVGIVAGYRHLLGRLKAKARPAETAKPKGTFSPAELDRYARHIVLREVGGPGQKSLKDAKVLVIGAGGLGSPVLLYLAAAGVGTIGVIDDDEVDASNLQRQVIHTDARIGMPKVFSAEEAMRALNPYITVRPYHRRLEEADAADLFAEYDLVLDGTDNFQTRFMVNRVAVATETPLIAAAIAQWEGQISLYAPAGDAPCYQCIFPEAPADGLAPSCAEAGVMGALPGVVGSMMAVEAIKEITGAGASLRGRMLLYDALYGENRQVTLKRRANCPICGNPDHA